MNVPRDIFLLLFFPLASVCSQTWQSQVVWFGQNGKLTYAIDAEGNRIPDFSHAGYRNGEEAIPDVPVVRYVSPVDGDNTGHIQASIDSFAVLPVSPSGFRGALLLSPGMYRIAGTIRVNVSGMVLRGAGEGPDTSQNTILLATGDSPHQRTVLIAGGPTQTRWADQETGTRTDITSDTVFVGERSFEVANALPFSVGDNIIIVHPCTPAWLAAIDSGGTASDPGWKENEQPIVYNRHIVSVDGNRLTVDAPVFNHLIRNISQSFVYRYARTNLRTLVGVEDLRIVIETADTTTNVNGVENHAWDAVLFQLVEDAWARRVTTLHFGQSGFKTATATRITVEACSALEPIGIITGERRYNFNTYTASQLILFKDCVASFGRHDFVSNGTSSVSGIVFTGCRSINTYATSEGHRRWSQGMLFDNLVFEEPQASTALGLYNRGDHGTGHGWAAVHSVAWNVSAASKKILVQKPPTAQNYAIGCTGIVTGSGTFPYPAGYIEPPGTGTLTPQSLWMQQLLERTSGGPAGGPGDESSLSPAEPWLHQNYPNPFNPSTRLSLLLPREDVVRLSVVDLLGREVALIAEGFHDAGSHTFLWDARAFASGVYMARLQTSRTVLLRSLLLLR